MRRTILVILTAFALFGGLGVAVAANGGGSTVTRARLEKSLPATFANIYIQQAHLLGRHDLTASSLQATAMCDKHGPDVADVGPGGDWVCLMSWTDPQVPMPTEGYGKFELNVHSNDCYTAAGPTKLTGFLTITDSHGKEVTNPAFEFDGCFDPNGDNTATGVEFPSVLNSASPSVVPDSQGRVSIKATCGTGSQGCAGSAVATAGDVKLGTVSFDVKEEATATISFPGALPPGTTEITVDFMTTTGVAGSDSVTIPVQSR
ncbi:MAG TPA: hypothetical protein VNS81_01265 [Nocardioides sp.]|nr:hypothetical protein [Nocardioides sp.]